MQTLCILSGARVVQIPVNYRQRIGQSMVCGNRMVAFTLGCQMIGLITRMRLKSWFTGSPVRRGPSPRAVAS